MVIDVFQDTVCPWCRIGKKHLYQAIDQWSGERIEIRWRAFQLDPSIPREGRPFSSLAEKFGGPERLEAMHERICQIGEACGLDFEFGRIQTLPNTLLSHRLIKITPSAQRNEMVDSVMDAHFEQGRDIGRMGVLLDIAEKLGLDRTETEQKLTHGDGMEAVEKDLDFAERAGISGVPMFILNDRFAISGVQPVEVFLRAFERTGM